MPWVANVPEEVVTGEQFGSGRVVVPEHCLPGPTSVVVSITEPGRFAKIPAGFAAVLRLKFQDYEDTRKHPAMAVLFHPRQADQLADFLTKHRGKNVVVHCAAGISRSGAVAEVVMEAFPEYEDRGGHRFPNGLVKRLLKRALGLVPIGAEVSS